MYIASDIYQSISNLAAIEFKDVSAKARHIYVILSDVTDYTNRYLVNLRITR